MRSAFRRGISAYDEALQRRPVLTKCLTSGAIAGAGDLLAQTFFAEENATFDAARFARFATLGGVLVGPTLHVWYGYLGSKIVGRSASATLKRVVLDQTVFTPIFLPIFLVSVGILEGKGLTKSCEDVSGIWASTVVSNWAWWTPVQIANFGFVPAQYQVLFSNAAGVVWNTYLSYVNQQTRLKNAEDASALVDSL
mmetsp:Transcript_19764/g.38705  ORF Transcript_19764/g.38705 Transcript_19764/m.38705 type:complete len:196 (-) Transcript_19764:381-968(-)